MKYSFYNGGHIYFFKPYKPIYDIRNRGKKQTALEFHKELTDMYNDPGCYVVNNLGRVIYDHKNGDCDYPAYDNRVRNK